MNLIENFEQIIKRLYGSNEVTVKEQLLRYNRIFEQYSSHFSSNDIFLFSTPGRTEIGGNHTDHNLGRVIAASVNLDTIAVISKNNDYKITLYSEGYTEPFKINLKNLNKVENEKGTTDSLIRGIAARFVELGYDIGGFSGEITSDVLAGSGLSSSASIEVLIGNIFNSLFNEEKISNKELAIIGQWVENNYFGKPCGLMDQIACSMGGIVSIDFENPENPEIEKVDFDFKAHGYKLLIVDTGGNHADLTEDYASIPREMKSVANLLGEEVCRSIDENTFLGNLKEIRRNVGDRAALRVFHFINENERVLKQMDALKSNDFTRFLESINESGDSSFKWLQNVYSIKNVKEQGISVALALTKKFIDKKGEGACRIHGGGFAGTIQVFLPEKYVDEYKDYIQCIIGNKKVMVLNIRSEGTMSLGSFH